MQVSRRLVALGAASAIFIGACSSPASGTPPLAAPAATGGAATGGAATASTGPGSSTPAVDYKACVAFDTGGLGDKGFNDLAKKGLDEAAAAGFTVAYSEAKGSTDYDANLQRLMDKGCQTIVAVGFNQQVPAQAAALANPDINFAQVDSTWDPSGPDGKVGTADDVAQPANYTGLDFQIDQAAMLAGYLAAGFTKTGIIGTYGGAQFPGVTRFMDGYFAGIAYYNQQKGTKVKLLGWDPKHPELGQFVGGDNPWGDAAKGEQFAKNFVDQGADIVGPVAGSTGNGSIKYMLSVRKWAIGVDTDQALSLPEDAAAIITSAQKVIDAAVFDTFQANAAGKPGGTNYVGTLANGGVALAPFHSFDSTISADVRAGIVALQAKLVDGSVKVADYLK